MPAKIWYPGNLNLKYELLSQSGSTLSGVRAWNKKLLITEMALYLTTVKIELTFLNIKELLNKNP